MKFPPTGWTPKGYEEKKAASGETKIEKDFTASEMLKKIQFYLIFFTFVFSAGAGLMSIGLMKLYPMEALIANGIPKLRKRNCRYCYGHFL